MRNERLDVPLLLLLMWSSFAVLAHTAAPTHVVVAAVTPSVWTEGVLIALITSLTTTLISLATLWPCRRRKGPKGCTG